MRKAQLHLLCLGVQMGLLETPEHGGRGCPLPGRGDGSWEPWKKGEAGDNGVHQPTQGIRAGLAGRETVKQSP